jgi:hypothetical protein
MFVLLYRAYKKIYREHKKYTGKLTKHTGRLIEYTGKLFFIQEGHFPLQETQKTNRDGIVSNARTTPGGGGLIGSACTVYPAYIYF